MAVEHYEIIEIDYSKKIQIVPASCKTLGVKGDKDSRVLHYRITACPDEVDLSSFIWEASYINALNEKGLQLIEDVQKEEDSLLLDFVIPASLCKEAGTVYVQLCARDTGGNVHWYVTPATFKVQTYTPVDPLEPTDPKYDIVEQLIDIISKGGADGKQGEKGDPFTYEDFTPEQLEALRGPAGKDGKDGADGKPFTYEDFTEEQLEALKGADGVMTFEDLTEEQKESLRGPEGKAGEPGKDGVDGAPGQKGDPFTYEDFTPEQLEALRGPEGKEGKEGKQGEQGKPFTYDDFTEEQLEALKGGKGDPFTFEDFTPEQLDLLKADAPIHAISVNGTECNISDHTVDLAIPTKTSQLTDDTGWLKDADLLARLQALEVLRISFVQILPEEGQPGILYFVHDESGEYGNVFAEFVYTGDGLYELIGASKVEVDLSSTWSKEEIGVATLEQAKAALA